MMTYKTISTDIDIHLSLIKEKSTPLENIPTTEESRLVPLNDVKAVLFDVYGTLFISGSGDVGSAQETVNHQLFANSLQEAGIDIKGSAGAAVEKFFFGTIHKTHQAIKMDGIKKPEVDIISIWEETLSILNKNELITVNITPELIARIAVIHECASNPVWPMPGCEEILAYLHEREYPLGIISNAQFYTPLLFKALLNKSLEELGFDPTLCAWSYKHRMAKPDYRFFETVLDQLQNGYDIYPEEILYVGNDMLNDVWTAQHLGCKTALFAGDKRSLRMRKDYTECQGLKPDVVIRNLLELQEIL